MAGDGGRGRRGETFMKILVTNDDGIRAEGIRHLAAVAAELGEVWVVAPEFQCSAMSQRITVHGEVTVKMTEFPVEGVKGYAVGGTPADCVKIGLAYLMPEKPDIVFSGVNHGYNAGYDIAYSGTVGAAMEALMQGVPAIAFSSQSNGVYEVLEHFIRSITRDLLGRPIGANEIWNVNFPGCSLKECRGICEVDGTAGHAFFLDLYDRTDAEDGSFTLTPVEAPMKEAQGDSDVSALLNNYITIGKIKNNLIR